MKAREIFNCMSATVVLLEILNISRLSVCITSVYDLTSGCARLRKLTDIDLICAQKAVEPTDPSLIVQSSTQQTFTENDLNALTNESLHLLNHLSHTMFLAIILGLLESYLMCDTYQYTALLFSNYSNLNFSKPFQHESWNYGKVLLGKIQIMNVWSGCYHML